VINPVERLTDWVDRAPDERSFIRRTAITVFLVPVVLGAVIGLIIGAVLELTT
jgi:hypothetical protein